MNELRNENFQELNNYIDGDTWYSYFSHLSPVPDNTQIKSRLTDLQNKLKILENNNFGFSQFDFKISPGELQKSIWPTQIGEKPWT